MNGLVGAKNMAGQAKLRKRVKTNGLKGISRGLKQGAWSANLKKKEKTNELIGAKNRGRGRPNLGKREKKDKQG